jgi:two-component system LytT family response regulator
VLLLSADPQVEVVGEAGNGALAVQMIRGLAPDLVFLDVRMPELDGFGVLRALDAEGAPAVVFVTAFDEHAVRAFDAGAADYLLKPFDDERFARALARAKGRVGDRRVRELAVRLAGMLGGAPAPPPASAPASAPAAQPAADAAPAYAERIVLRDAGRISFVPYFHGDYVVILRDGTRLRLSRSRRERLQALLGARI